MVLIPSQMLQIGMTTVNEVHNKKGQMLIPSGAIITDRHLRGIKIWGIENVDVDAGDLDIDQLAQTIQANVAPDTDAVHQFLTELFLHNQELMKHPFMMELHSLCETFFSTSGIPKSALKSGGIAKYTPAETDSAPLSKTELKTTADLLKRSKNLASPPDIYTKLMDVMGRAGSSSASIAAVIENDPGLTARLLRIVNSAYYSFPSPIETISRAITIVGTDELRNMVLVTSVINRFSKGLEALIDMEQFWKHSIACALFSKQIAMLRNDQNAERFFTTGLLHDIGRLILFLQMPDEMAQLLTNQDAGKDSYRMERLQLGFTHTQVGKELADSWRLSARQSEAIQFHHTPLGAKRFAVDAAILHIADIMSNALQIGTSGSGRIPQFVPETWEQINIPPGSLSRMNLDVQREVADLIRIFYEKTP